MTDVRPPAVAGQFYEGTETALRDQLETCFTHRIGPGAPPDSSTGARSIHAGVVPHAGVPFSGPVAAHTYRALAAHGVPETVVVIGPSHRGGGAPVAVAPNDAWQTPLGEVTIDKTLREAVIEHVGPAEADPRPHAGEHSAEVQVPFLQYIADEIRLLPIVLSRQSPVLAETLGNGLTAAIDAIPREAVVLASSDLTHYRPDAKAREADRPVLDAIEALDKRAIFEQKRTGHSMCGPGAIAAACVVAANHSVDTGEVHAYATSADTAGDPDRVVGYSAATFAPSE